MRMAAQDADLCHFAPSVSPHGRLSSVVTRKRMPRLGPDLSAASPETCFRADEGGGRSAVWLIAAAALI